MMIIMVQVSSLDGFRLETPRTPKTSELIARELAAYIVDNDLPAGTRLPNERDMLASLGVGRTTLREALRNLETRGVIRIRAGRQGGPVVRRPRAEDLSDALSLILQFEKASLSEVLHARAAIEPTTARLAAQLATADQLATLRSTIDTMLEQADDQSVFLRENQMFHLTVAEASGSSVLRIFAESLSSIADGVRAGITYTGRRRRAVAAAHLRILEALEAKDPDAADAAMREHLTEAGNFWQAKYAHLYGAPVRWL
jgi:DNA-binding FadR family transcriptional regulator